MYKILINKNGDIPYIRQLFVYNYVTKCYNNDYRPEKENIKLSYCKSGIVFYVNTELQAENIYKLLNNNIPDTIKNDRAFYEKREYLLEKYNETVNACLKYFCNHCKNELSEIFETNNIDMMMDKIKETISDIESVLISRNGFDTEQLNSFRGLNEENTICPR